MKQTLINTPLSLMAFLLIGCGGGSNTSSSNDSTTKFPAEYTPPIEYNLPQKPLPDTNTLYFKAEIKSMEQEIEALNIKRDSLEVENNRIPRDPFASGPKSSEIRGVNSQIDMLYTKIKLAYINELTRMGIENGSPTAIANAAVLRTLPLDQIKEIYAFTTGVPLLATSSPDLSSQTSFRQARTVSEGKADFSRLKVNGASSQSFEFTTPLFIQLKGDIAHSTTTKVTGSAAYRLGNTVIGAIHGYANSGAGFKTANRQFETSVVASQSIRSFFIESQIGSASVHDTYLGNLSGIRSQITLGVDGKYVSPFIQISHRTLTQSEGFGLKENTTSGYVGVDMDILTITADIYSITNHFWAKAGCELLTNTKSTGFSGSIEWSSSLQLNNGIVLSTNLDVNIISGSMAGLQINLNR